jgi:hypothetical protein
VAALVGARGGWTHISEDEVWIAFFGTNRSPFGSAEHRVKRQTVQAHVFGRLQAEVEAGRGLAIDVTLHESPPEAYLGYRDFLDKAQIPWAIRVLHPSLAVAIARDAARGRRRPIGPDAIAALRAKFTGKIFKPRWFVDTSADTPEQTVARLLRSGVA